jgi:hypothetical protein
MTLEALPRLRLLIAALAVAMTGLAAPHGTPARSVAAPPQCPYHMGDEPTICPTT